MTFHSCTGVSLGLLICDWGKTETNWDWADELTGTFDLLTSHLLPLPARFNVQCALAVLAAEV